MPNVSGTNFAAPGAKDALERGNQFTPKFNADGLVSAIVCDAKTGEVLMLAHMNEEALTKTLETGKAYFWSRSRQKLWLKGETSGNILEIKEMRTDCDQDAILLKVTVLGDQAACHTGARSCFYRRMVVLDGAVSLVAD